MKDYLLNAVENVVAKGEIACFDQFFLLLQCFQESSAADVSKCVCRWERVNSNIDKTLLIIKQC